MEYIIAWIIGAPIAAIVLYYLVHTAVLSALRSHSVWERDGGLEKALADRVRVQAESAPTSPAE